MSDHDGKRYFIGTWRNLNTLAPVSLKLCQPPSDPSAVMQVSPGKYLENLRLATAQQLVQTGIGLKQIAARTGYASPSTLSRALGRRA
jgi:hypothetical protein